MLSPSKPLNKNVANYFKMALAKMLRKTEPKLFYIDFQSKKKCCNVY